MKPSVGALVEQGPRVTQLNQCEPGRLPRQTIIPSLIREIQRGENYTKYVGHLPWSSFAFIKRTF